MKIYRCNVTFSLDGKEVEAEGGTDASSQAEAEQLISNDLLATYEGATNLRFFSWEVQDLDEMDRIAEKFANEHPQGEQA